MCTKLYKTRKRANNIPKLEIASMKYAYCLMVAQHINKSKANKMQNDGKC